MDQNTTGTRMSRRQMLQMIGGVAAAALLAACGGGDAPAGYDPTMPPETPPALTMTSESGTWVVSAWLYPERARKGANEVVFGIVDGAGAPADGLVVRTQPWMPAHGHGTSTVPTVSPQGAGLYWAMPVNLYMAGRWELRTTITGAVEDHVVLVVDVP